MLKDNRQTRIWLALLCLAISAAALRANVGRTRRDGPAIHKPICGGAAGLVCKPGAFCRYPDGTCDHAGVFGTCVVRPAVCPEVYDPVCGCDGVTYHNRCHTDTAGVPVDHPGACREVCGGIAGVPCDNAGEFCKLPVGGCCCDYQGLCTPIPGWCPDVWDPVCGCDGVTYGNECDADAAAVSIDHRGECPAVCGGIAGIGCEEGVFCKLPIGECCCDFQGICTPTGGGCPAIWDPVCGCDGVTYSSQCDADAAGMSVDHIGECAP